MTRLLIDQEFIARAGTAPSQTELEAKNHAE
jgi:hypothetical protein